MVYFNIIDIIVSWSGSLGRLILCPWWSFPFGWTIGESDPSWVEDFSQHHRCLCCCQCPAAGSKACRSQNRHRLQKWNASRQWKWNERVQDWEQRKWCRWKWIWQNQKLSCELSAAFVGTDGFFERQSIFSTEFDVLLSCSRSFRSGLPPASLHSCPDETWCLTHHHPGRSVPDSWGKLLGFLQHFSAREGSAHWFCRVGFESTVSNFWLGEWTPMPCASHPRIWCNLVWEFQQDLCFTWTQNKKLIED